MALRFRRSVLRLAENYRVTCAGGSIARGATCTGERCVRPSRSIETAKRVETGLRPSSAKRRGPPARPDGPHPSSRRSRHRTANLRHDPLPEPQGRLPAQEATSGGGRPFVNCCRQCGAWWGPYPGRSRHPHIALRSRRSVLRPTENHRVTCAGRTVALSAMSVERGPAAERANRGSALRSRWRMVGPVVRPKPASPHGTPLPRKRATADGESPCHMRRENHNALGDACCRVWPGGRIGRNGVSPSAGGGAWWGPPPGRSRHPHMSLRFRGSVLRPAENYRVHAPVEA